jgi:membrane protein YdbS with pleckstrin-like domain
MRQKRLGTFEPVFRDHWLTLLPKLSVALVVTGLLIAGILFIEWTVVRLLALFTLTVWGWFGFHFLRWRQRRYLLKEGRLHVLDGFLVRNHQDIKISFPPVVTEQGLVGRLLNFGRLTVGRPPNDFCIPQLNNFSLAEHLLTGEKAQPQAPEAKPTIVVQPPPVTFIFPLTLVSPYWPGDLLAGLDGDSFGSWDRSDFSGPWAQPQRPLDEKVVIPNEPWESEASKDERVFHASHGRVHATLRARPSIFDELTRLSGKIITLLLDYLEAVGEGVILAAQWICQQRHK